MFPALEHQIAPVGNCASSIAQLSKTHTEQMNMRFISHPAL
jgi:hypothetical protein